MSLPASSPPQLQRRRRIDRRWIGVLVVAVALVAAAGAWFVLRGDGEPTPGPLTSPDATSGGFGRTAGRPFGFGLAVAWNTGDRPAVLERIEPVDMTPGLRVLDTRASGPDRDSLSVAATRQWPSDEFTDLHPVKGFEVAPHTSSAGERGVELVFGLQADKPGRYEMVAVAVEYTVAGKRHRAIIRNGIAVCVTPPGEPTIRGCDTPRILAEDQ